MESAREGLQHSHTITEIVTAKSVVELYVHVVTTAKNPTHSYNGKNPTLTTVGGHWPYKQPKSSFLSELWQQHNFQLKGWSES